VTLWAGCRRAHLNERVASVMQRFEDLCVERFDIDSDAHPTVDDVLSGRRPAAVLVHGDTSSAMAAALSVFHLHIPVMHVEAGLRTGGSNLTPFPEELNRQVISKIGAMHLAPTSANLQNLVREGIPVSQVFVTGNTGIDALHWASSIEVRFANPELQALHDGDSRIVVITAHRRENWGDGLRGIAEGLARLAGDPEACDKMASAPPLRRRQSGEADRRRARAHPARQARAGAVRPRLHPRRRCPRGRLPA
jgi:UDP-N-acetylglucosamine 2-epimerase (non-hydrolysing)